MRRWSIIALAVALAVPSTTSAQVSWVGPPLVGTASPTGLSLFAVDPGPGAGLGALAQWRHAQGALEMGYRVGLAEDAVDGVALFGGIDVSGILARGVEDADVDVRWWSGVGAGVGDELLLSVPVGIVVGWQGAGDDAVFAPYAGGHAVLDIGTGEGDAVDLRASVDVGLDLTLVSGWVVRFGASLGGGGAVALGIRMPRGVRRQD